MGGFRGPGWSTDLVHKWLVKEVRSSYAEVEDINFLENGIVKCI